MRGYKLEHIVGFEETNLVGNVYFVNHLKWQGRCREMFLRDHAPGIVRLLESGKLALVTVSCGCEYYDELKAFDEVTVIMYLEGINQNRISMTFKYLKNIHEGDKVIAKGTQAVACMERSNYQLIPVEIPEELKIALNKFC